jgi:hypothetical protein
MARLTFPLIPLPPKGENPGVYGVCVCVCVCVCVHVPHVSVCRDMHAHTFIFRCNVASVCISQDVHRYSMISKCKHGGLTYVSHMHYGVDVKQSFG